MKINITIIFLITICLSCSKNDDTDGESPEIIQKGNFLEEVEVGDKMLYSLLLGYDYYSIDPADFFYTGDTLELEVLEISAAGVLISQRITPASNMMADTVNYYWNKDSVYVNNWTIDGDSLFVQSDQAYFSTHLIQVPRLKFSDDSEQQVEIEDWRTSYNYTEANAQLYATNYTLFDHFYDSLSVYIHNEPMSYDGNGNTTVFSKKAGVVRSSDYGWWTQSGFGWDRIW